jgi:hypothetical protein
MYKLTWPLIAATMAALVPLTANVAQASPPSAAPSASTPAARPKRHPRASLAIDVGKAAPWVGQALPVTVTAVFRGVESATLEGAPQLTTTGVATSELAREPRQTQESIGGEPTLVVKWTGVVTPSSPGPIGLAVALPVRLRYRDAVVRRPAPPVSDDDPFGDRGDDLFGSSMFRELRQRMHQQMESMTEAPVGRLHEDVAALEAVARPLDAIALPLVGQPATFSGAVGQFELRASASPTQVRVSEPVTLRITVGGSGDLDRVDVPGVASSDAWKAYPPRPIKEATAAGTGPARRVFEQVLVPLRDGALAVPPVSLTAFDPASGGYVTRQTLPLVVTVAPPAIAPDPVVDRAPMVETSVVAPQSAPSSMSATMGFRFTPLRIAWAVSALLLFGLGAGLHRFLRGERLVWSLRRAMRRASRGGSVEVFLAAAHQLIAAALAPRWGVSPDEVSARSIRARLGLDGEPLAAALEAEEAWRFGGASLGGTDLRQVCRSIEQTLRTG